MTVPIGETQKAGLSRQQHENLLMLLLSPARTNRLLAFQLMEGNILFAEAMAKELLIMSKFSTVAEWRRKAQNLILQNNLLLASFEAMALEEGLQILDFIEEYKDSTHYGGGFNFDNTERFEQIGDIDHFLLDEYLQKYSAIHPLLDDLLIVFREEDALYHYYLDVVGALLYFDRFEQAAYMERCYERLTNQSLIVELS
ncbi:MAG: hypothetical protein GY810_17875 [Aureispira sp.]|nr:hypothetical protein [Aureispira sp.]